MAIFFKNIGDRMRQQYAARSIGSGGQEVRRFSMKDIETYVEGLLDAYELMSMRSKVDELAPTGFQIWGIPEAASVVSDMKTGDFLMLLEGTDFVYVGQVLHRISQPCRELFGHIWEEQEFPHIAFLLEGELIDYLWDDFLDQFAFSHRLRRGTLRRLSDERVAASSARTEEAFIATLLRTTGIKAGRRRRGFPSLRELEDHFRLVKARGRSR